MKKSIHMVAGALALALTGGSAFMTGTALADAEGEMEYRKAVMKSIGGNMGATVAILKGKTANKANLQAHADGLVALATLMPTVFAKGSAVGKTTMLPKVWDEPAKLNAAIKAFQGAAAGLQGAAMSGDMKSLAAAVGTLGKTCKDCHGEFRKKKEMK